MYSETCFLSLLPLSSWSGDLDLTLFCNFQHYPRAVLSVLDAPFDRSGYENAEENYHASDCTPCCFI